MEHTDRAYDEFVSKIGAEYGKFFPVKEDGTVQISISCWDGWFPLLEEFFQKLAALNQPVQILQIKEKFGGLRIYLSNSNEEISDLVEATIAKANNTCEMCGEKGEVMSSHGWLRCICPACAVKV